jgi:hypothetical protein
MIIFAVNHFVRALPAPRRRVPVYQYLEFPDLRVLSHLGKVHENKDIELLCY